MADPLSLFQNPGVDEQLGWPAFGPVDTHIACTSYVYIVFAAPLLASSIVLLD